MKQSGGSPPPRNQHALMDTMGQSVKAVAHLKVAVEVVVNEKKSACVDGCSVKNRVCGSPEGSYGGGGE